MGLDVTIPSGSAGALEKHVDSALAILSRQADSGNTVAASLLKGAVSQSSRITIQVGSCGMVPNCTQSRFDGSKTINLTPSTFGNIFIIGQKPDVDEYSIRAASPERIIIHELGHAVTGMRDNGPLREAMINSVENPIMRPVEGFNRRTSLVFDLDDYRSIQSPFGMDQFNNIIRNNPGFSQGNNFGSAASGGFLLYPNKANSNAIGEAYRK